MNKKIPISCGKKKETLLIKINCRTQHFVPIICFLVFLLVHDLFSQHSSNQHDHSSNKSLANNSHTNSSSSHDDKFMSNHKGMYGNYPMTRDATGTAWMPESTQMPGIHTMYRDWLLMLHGFAFVVADHQSGPRGANALFSENMFMFTAQKDIGCSTVAFRSMIDLEPATMGKCGFPLLLQTGETCNGITPLIDRQHPHDFLMEIAGVYSVTCFDDDSSFFFYFGLPGEPALGPPVYIHRFSSVYNPEAPITHHWFDSTHITFGVATAGFIRNTVKLDASLFTGREPDQHRWWFDKPKFDSYSIRFSLNPTPDIAAQVSHAFLKSPEQLHPDVNTHRTTATLSYNKIGIDYKWQTTLGWGRNKNVPHFDIYKADILAEIGTHRLNAFLLESTIELQNRHIIFGRAEYVAKDELFVLPNPRALETFNVGKIDLGYIYEFSLVPYTQWGLGGVISASFVPKEIKCSYGGTPISGMVFLRVELREPYD